MYSMTEKKRDYIHSTRSNPTSRVDKKLILQIVREVEDGVPRKDVCTKYGMAYCTLNEWIRKFCSEEFLTARRKTFSTLERRTIVKAVQTKKITKPQAYEIYKVSKKTLNTWLRQAKQEEFDLVGSNLTNMPANTIACSENLNEELKEARLKIKALETMIDIAEHEFKIAIRKKPGAKQLSK